MNTKIWHVDYNRDIHPGIRDSHDNPIATIALADTLAETQAIANLIAAAPELLAALQAVYDELPEEEGISTRHSTRVAAAKALAAIAQAKGEAA